MFNTSLNKHQIRAQELKDVGRYGKLRDLMSVNCSDEWWAAALEYLKNTGDTNGFDVMLKGA